MISNQFNAKLWQKSSKNLLLKYFTLFFIFISQLTFAQCIATNEECAPVNEWEISLAVGAGVLTNPLHGGSNIPLVLIPKISYYGEKIFLENNVLGYSVYETSAFSFSALSMVNRENAFFNRWHPNNIFVPTLANGITESSPSFDDQINKESTSPAIDFEEVANRKWALDAGMQVNWFISTKNHLKIQVLHDVNNAYNGFNGQIEFNHRFTVLPISNTRWQITAGVNWLSRQQVDYYYGLGEKDNVEIHSYYQKATALNPYIKIQSSYEFNEKWRLTFSARTEFLASTVSNSPLVQDKRIDSLFLGVVYAY